VERVLHRSEVRNAYQIFVGKFEDQKPSLNIGVGGMLINMYGSAGC
jgi:hypothetical protein